MMDDAGTAGDGPRCVCCGRCVKTLFVQYSPGNIRLMKCDNCKAGADPYIECEFMITLIDLILHKTRAYRHLLFNKLPVGSSLHTVGIIRYHAIQLKCYSYVSNAIRWTQLVWSSASYISFTELLVLMLSACRDCPLTWLINSA